jgi:DNA-binding CsgD family transcriptional regulator
MAVPRDAARGEAAISDRSCQVRSVLVVASVDLRPIERRMTSMADAGLTPAETGRRFHRSGRYVEQVLRLAQVPRKPVSQPNSLENSLRPLERRLLRWRDQGVDAGEVAAMFGRSPEHIERVLALVDYKQRLTT